jgi:hypothetical protein
MATRKTWIWIIVSILAVCVIAMIAVAGFGVYFVASHIKSERLPTAQDAHRRFDEAKAVFKDQKPLVEIDQRERPHITRAISSLPTGTAKPEYLRILAWDPDKPSRVVSVNLPFWLLRFGGRKINVFEHGGGFDFDRMNVDVRDLERIGPILLLDYRATTGERVLVWTK